MTFIWSGFSNPRVRVRDKAEYTKSYERLGCHPVRLTTLLSVLICYFVVGSVVGTKTLIRIFIIKSVTYGHYMAEEVGFEPTVDFHLRRFSRPVHSTTLPLLRLGKVLPRQIRFLKYEVSFFIKMGIFIN